MRSFSTLQIALGVSIAVHAALLTIRFVDPEAFNRVFEDTPLEVILVNAKTFDKPDKARAIAQANMAGGGNADKGRATSPLPRAQVSMQGEVSEKDRERQLREMQEQQKVLLSKVKTVLAAMPPTDPLQKKLSPDDVQREEKRRQLIELLAEIERRIQMENERPKKHYISPATREAVYAIYYDHLRHAIEDKGTEDFPEANGQKLYGELTMIVTVNHDGRVLSTEVVQSSGKPLLDRRAQAIARSAGPFGTFNSEMRRQADQIAVVSRFKFTRDDTLQTRLNAP
ncbi:TonB family protein [Rhodoferax sp.]|uniref:energy transducer TonB n=1 Tax=Rhodoferax sp. TaxID=50421 RepID=UPI00283EB4FA|nr:TonB family protein [Rhodoferax sp.]MDR3371454.1 TonB family protein [Rhodoferax sp.]